MWYTRRQQEHIPFFDLNRYNLSVFDDAHDYIAFELIEQLFCFVVVKVFTAVGAAYDHYDKIIYLLVHLLITYRWFQQVTVFIDPFVQVKGTLYGHNISGYAL
ncbi:hypothetical protein D3C87_1505000 [compost metagenome]